MKTRIGRSLPLVELRMLEFLVGDFISLQTLYPADHGPVLRYECLMRGSREACDRFVRTEFFSDPPGIGVESACYMVAFNKAQDRYELHGFLSSCDEVLRLSGGWVGNALELHSDPAGGIDGLQRYRQRLTPMDEGQWHFLQERWELEGYVKHLEGRFIPCPI